MENSKIVQKLNNLITVLKDADLGFHAAAEEVRDLDLKTLLHSFAQNSASIRSEIQNQVSMLGGEPNEDGTFTGKCQRIWMEIKTAFTDKDEKVVLGDCESAQKSVQDEFDDVLQTEGLPRNIKELVARHFETIQEITAKVKERHERFAEIQGG